MVSQTPLIIPLVTTPKPGWPCPNCGGWGHMPDGSCSISQDEVRIWPATPCHVCKGKGRVLVSPLPD